MEAKASGRLRQCYPNILLHVHLTNNFKGFGAITCGAREVTDGMFFAGAKKVADSVTDEEIKNGTVYPNISRVRLVNLAVAEAVCEAAVRDGVSDKKEPAGGWRKQIVNTMWTPEAIAKSNL